MPGEDGGTVDAIRINRRTVSLARRGPFENLSSETNRSSFATIAWKYGTAKKKIARWPRGWTKVAVKLASAGGKDGGCWTWNNNADNSRWYRRLARFSASFRL